MTPPDDLYISLADRCHREHSHLKQIDLMRTVGCLLVLFSHAARPVMKHWHYNGGMLLWDIFGDNISCLFFIISGAMLLPIRNGGNREFFRRRLLRILAPFIIYVVAYLTLSYLTGATDHATFVHSLEWFWLLGGNETNWFMLVLIGAYLFMPFISPWMRYATRRQTENFLLLWLVATLLPYLNVVCGVLQWSTPGRVGSWLRMFYNYFGFFILGYYLVRWPFATWSKRFKTIMIVCAIGAIAFIPFSRFMFNSYFIQYQALATLSFVTAAKVSVWFVFLWQFGNIGGIAAKCIKLIARYSYSIYLCHPIWCWILLPCFMPQTAQSIWNVPLTLLLTLLTVWPLSHIPYIGRYMR